MRVITCTVCLLVFHIWSLIKHQPAFPGNYSCSIWPYHRSNEDEEGQKSPVFLGSHPCPATAQIPATGGTVVTTKPGCPPPDIFQGTIHATGMSAEEKIL